MPQYGRVTKFEKLTSGSSLGQYSLLRAHNINEGYLKFKVTSNRASQIFRIDSQLLNEVRSKYSILDREMTRINKWLYLEGGVPICDFKINQERKDVLKRKARNI